MRIGISTLIYLLLQIQAVAQTTVSGRVLDKSAKPLPGVTILQRNTTHAISSDTAGQFVLTVPEQLDSMNLVIASFGFVTQQLQVTAGSFNTIRLVEDTTVISCGVLVATSTIEYGLISGIRYAPIGAQVGLFGARFLRLPINATAAYQTNLRRNYVLQASLSLPIISTGDFRLSLGSSLLYQSLRVTQSDVQFRSYSGRLNVHQYRLGRWRLPVLQLSAGYARLAQSREEVKFLGRPGVGYGFGLSHDFLPGRFKVRVEAHATRWLGNWQFQSKLTHRFGMHYHAGVALNALPRYREVSLSLNRSFY